MNPAHPLPTHPQIKAAVLPFAKFKVDEAVRAGPQVGPWNPA